MAAIQHRQSNLDNQGKKGGKDQETIQSSTTPDPGYHIGKLNITNKSQEPKHPLYIIFLIYVHTRTRKQVYLDED